MLKKEHDEKLLARRRDGQNIIRPISFPDKRLSQNVNLIDYMSDVEEQGDMNTW